jgi:hypothetical protein
MLAPARKNKDQSSLKKGSRVTVGIKPAGYTWAETPKRTSLESPAFWAEIVLELNKTVAQTSTLIK